MARRLRFQVEFSLQINRLQYEKIIMVSLGEPHVITNVPHMWKRKGEELVVSII